MKYRIPSLRNPNLIVLHRYVFLKNHDYIVIRGNKVMKGDGEYEWQIHTVEKLASQTKIWKDIYVGAKQTSYYNGMAYSRAVDLLK